jgi:hypothetical protein
LNSSIRILRIPINIDSINNFFEFYYYLSNPIFDFSKFSQINFEIIEEVGDNEEDIKKERTPGSKRLK